MGMLTKTKPRRRTVWIEVFQKRVFEFNGAVTTSLLYDVLYILVEHNREASEKRIPNSFCCETFFII